MIKLIKSYLKRDKVGVITIAVLSLCAVFMLIIGMSISNNIDTLYEDKMDELSEYHIQYWYDAPSQAVGEYTMALRTLVDRGDIDRMDHIEELTLSGKPGDMIFTMLISTQDEEYITNSWWRVDFRDIYSKNNKAIHNTSDTSLGEGEYGLWMNKWYYDMVVMPDALYEINIGDKKFKLKLMGYVDDVTVMYSSINYIDHRLYDMLKEEWVTEEAGVNREIYSGMGIILSNPSEKTVKKVTQDLYEKTAVVTETFGKIYPDYAAREKHVNDWNYILTKEASHPYIKLLGIALIAFSVLITLIAIASLSFIISTALNSDVKNIGILRAQGYTTTQLRKSYLILYGVVVGIAVLLGVILGIALMPAFVHIITMMSNLTFNVPVSVLSIFVAIIAVLGIILLSVWWTTRKLGKITPLHAVRRNTSIHSFKHNYVPLDKARVNVNIALGLKSVFNNLKQSGVLCAIVVIICMLSSFVCVVYHNLNVDRTAMVNLSGIERADLDIYYNAGDNLTNEEYDITWEIFEKLDKYIDMDDRVVGKNRLYQATGIEPADKDYIVVDSYTDYDMLRTDFLYKGSYPKEKNEVVIPYGYAEDNGYEIGDMIRVELQYDLLSAVVSYDLMVVGYSQSLIVRSYNHFMVTEELMLEAEQVMSESLGRGVNLLDRTSLYFQEEYRHQDFYNALYYNLKNQLEQLLEGVDESLANKTSVGASYVEMNIYQTVFAVAEPASKALLTVFIVVSVLVILLLLAMILKIKIMKEGEEYAIMKAQGYTSADIMLSISISLLVVSLVASLVGCILGGLLTTPLLNLVGSMFGVGNMNFIVNWLYMLGIFGVVNVLIFGLSMLLTLRIRSISPIKMLRAN